MDPIVPDSVSSKKTTHKVFELAAKLEIINISASFVAGFREIAKEKQLAETLLNSAWPALSSLLSVSSWIAKPQAFVRMLVSTASPTRAFSEDVPKA